MLKNCHINIFTKDNLTLPSKSTNLLLFSKVCWYILQQLETRLAEKEEQLLEKELISEQVTRLADRVKKRAETGKDDTLDLAKKVFNSDLFKSNQIFQYHQKDKKSHNQSI